MAEIEGAEEEKETPQVLAASAVSSASDTVDQHIHQNNHHHQRYPLIIL